MIARAGQQARLPIAALAALALLAFIAFSSIRPTFAPAAVNLASSSPATSQTLGQRPIVVTDTNSCAAGTAYVTGDLVGDASPAEVLKSLCP